MIEDTNTLSLTSFSRKFGKKKFKEYILYIV